ncbi:MAG: hypothetical protein FWF15_07570, partial [Oscillospiraceae bacterium]|nr:hypothetical protein [Oscillospiraceae bacterium]
NLVLRQVARFAQSFEFFTEINFHCLFDTPFNHPGALRHPSTEGNLERVIPLFGGVAMRSIDGVVFSHYNPQPQQSQTIISIPFLN